MFEEETFFGGEKGIGSPDEGAEGGGHLQGHEEEDADPDSEGRGFARSGLGEHFQEEAGSEEEGDKPGCKNEEAEESL